MLYKNYYDLATQIFAEEMDALGKILRQHFTPGLLGAATLADITYSGAPNHIATAVDFVAGDLIYSGAALMDAWYDRVVDFLLEGPGGGALPADTYDLVVYPHAVDMGGGRMVYQAHLQAVEHNTVDEQLYLVVREDVIWDGAQITNPGTDGKYYKYGLIDLGVMGRGDNGEIIVDGGRDVSFVNEVIFDGGAELSAGQVLDVKATAEISVSGVLDIENGGVQNLRSGGQLLAKSGSNADFEAGSVLNMFGNTEVESGGTHYQKDGSLFKFQSADFAGTPNVNEFCCAAVPRAGGYITSLGVLSWGWNVDSITHVADTGNFTVNLKRGFSSAAEYGVVLSVHNNTVVGGLQSSITYDITDGDTFDVNVRYDDQASGSWPALTDAGFSGFFFVVFGGDQTI